MKTMKHVERTEKGYIAPNGMELTPTEDWLSARGFHTAAMGVEGFPHGRADEIVYFLNWPHMSFTRLTSHCIRIWPGCEGIEIVGCNREVALLPGCWPPDRVSELWKVITGQDLKVNE